MNTWMKPVCLLLSVAILSLYSAPAFAQDSDSGSLTESCFKSEARGKLDAARNHSSTGWFVGGVVSGVILGLIGTAIITGVSAASNPKPNYLEFPKEDETNMPCYINGYKSKGKKKNMKSAVLGGLLGTVVFLAVYYSVSE